jgi:hypothetical protein
MMEAARTSETSADIQLRTRQYIREDSELHTRRRENLKSQEVSHVFSVSPGRCWDSAFNWSMTIFIYILSNSSFTFPLFDDV